MSNHYCTTTEYPYGIKVEKKNHDLIKKCREWPRITVSTSGSEEKLFKFRLFLICICRYWDFSYKVQLRKIFLFYKANLSKIQINSLMHFLHKLIMNKHNPVALRTDAIL